MVLSASAFSSLPTQWQCADVSMQTLWAGFYVRQLMEGTCLVCPHLLLQISTHTAVLWSLCPAVMRQLAARPLQQHSLTNPPLLCGALM